MRSLVPVLGLAAVLVLPAAAQDYPALHDVTGVAANDVLNVRTAPDAGAAIVGVLAPDARDVEVVETTPAGDWARVSANETSGWAAMRFLARQPGPDWTALQTNLSCYGTEPFWNATLNPAKGTAIVARMDTGTELLTIPWSMSGTSLPAVAGFRLKGGTGEGFATVTATQCGDGMSDAVLGLSVTLFMAGNAGPVAFSGCCSLVP
jgi:uncharacterized membrane protein